MEKKQILSLYRQLLKSSRLFTHYNFREYVYTRTRDAFHANKNIQDEKLISSLYQQGLEDLKVAQRQGWLNAQFSMDPLVVESL